MKERDNTEKVYVINADTKVNVDSKAGKASDIVNGQEIELTIVKGGTVALTINVTSIEEDIKGTVKSVSTSTNKITVEYESDRTTKTVELAVDKNTNIYVNDKKADLKDIKAGDSVELKVKNKLVLQMDAKSKLSEIEGIIKEITIDTKEVTPKHFIKITNAKDETKEYEIDPKAYIYRKGRSAKIEELRIGDKVILDLEYDIVMEIDADVVIKKLEGHITGINTRVSQSTIITIRNRETNKDEEYVLSKDVYIRVDNVAATASDLKINYYANVVVEGNQIVEIYSESRSSNSTILGKVTYVDPRGLEFEISVDSYNQDGYKYGDLIRVYAKPDVIINDVYSTKLGLKDLKKGNLVNVIGTSDGTTFSADIIVILK